MYEHLYFSQLGSNMSMKETVANILNGEVTVGEAEDVLEPYQMVHMVGRPYSQGNFDSEAVYARKDTIYELQNHLQRKEINSQSSMDLAGKQVSLPEAMVEATRIPYKTVANTFNSLRYNHTGELPELLDPRPYRNQATPERFSDYMEGDKDHEIVKTDMPLLAMGFSSALGTSSFLGVVPLVISGYLVGENETLRSQNGLMDSVEQELNQTYLDLTEELEDHRIEPI